MSRQTEWKEIWEAKGRRRTDALHVIDGYDVVDAAGWEQLVRSLMAPIQLRPGMAVTELGCGAGAFLETLLRMEPGLQLTGMDYAESLVEIARQRLPGTFCVGDIRNCPGLPSASADLAMSFGVMLYLDAETDVRRALREIDRVAKPGAQIYIGEISDLAQQGLAESLRKSTHANRTLVSPRELTHFYLPQGLFADEGRQLGWQNIRIVPHRDIPGLATNPAAGYRFSVYATKRA